jgi:hypothetical protein
MSHLNSHSLAAQFSFDPNSDQFLSGYSIWQPGAVHDRNRAKAPCGVARLHPSLGLVPTALMRVTVMYLDGHHYPPIAVLGVTRHAALHARPLRLAPGLYAGTAENSVTPNPAWPRADVPPLGWTHQVNLSS